MDPYKLDKKTEYHIDGHAFLRKNYSSTLEIGGYLSSNFVFLHLKRDIRYSNYVFLQNYLGLFSQALNPSNNFY